jgi:hypothetical protein
MDITRIASPIFMILPISFLEASADYCCPDRILSLQDERDAVKRITRVVQWAIEPTMMYQTKSVRLRNSKC